MAMALAARGDFLAVSAAGAAGLAGGVLVALVTDGEAVFAGVGLWVKGLVFTVDLETFP